MTAAPGVEGVIQNLAIKLYCSIFGKNATATKFTPGGGSTSGGGVGRPKGYVDDNGTPNYNHEGKLLINVPCCGIFAGDAYGVGGVGTFRDWGLNGVWHQDVTELDVNYSKDSRYPSVGGEVNFYIKAPVTGIYYVYSSDFGSSGSVLYVDSSTTGYKKADLKLDRIENRTKNTNKNILTVANGCLSLFCNAGDDFWVISGNRCSSSFAHFSGKSCIVVVDPASSHISNSNSITINNNTWNGNIYTDNSTNLTYIYPQYTTVNEKNETVTNISNTPIIYNNETKKYYTYDTVTNNYYYISYEPQTTPTPSPSPTPAPTEKPGGSISTPETGKPGGDTGDTTGILAVLVEIRDNMIQGFLDIKAAFVAGFAELSANFTLAIENLNVNIQNVFNKKFPDQSTPETALPSPTPSPSPAPTDPPSPSPAPDPGKPDSGDKTNNFWTIIFPNGGGSEDGKKGIFWALVSLILALIAFFANLAVGVGYLFPFLPDGVVMTINTCLIVIFLFTIIKFIMRSK